MGKRVASAQGEATPVSEGSEDKLFKQSGPAKKVKISPTVISVDSPERTPGALLALEGDALGVS